MTEKAVRWDKWDRWDLHYLIRHRLDDIFEAIGAGVVPISIPLVDPPHYKVLVPEGVTVPETISIVHDGLGFVIPIESGPLLPLLFPR